MTYLFQEERGKNFYRIQTDEKNIAQILKRRNSFHISGIGFNVGLWIFTCEFSRPDIAKKTLKSITGKKAKIDLEGVISY